MRLAAMHSDAGLAVSVESQIGALIRSRRGMHLDLYAHEQRGHKINRHGGAIFIHEDWREDSAIDTRVSPMSRNHRSLPSKSATSSIAS
jgi:hypothetical protein